MYRGRAVEDVTRAKVEVGGGGQWGGSNSSFGRQWGSTGEDGTAAGDYGKWVPDPNPSAVVEGGDKLLLLIFIYFAASLSTSSAVFASSGDGVR